MKGIEERQSQIREQISVAVNRLYDCNGSIEITEISEVFPDNYSKIGLSEAIEAGVIINEHGRVHLHQDVFFGMFENRCGVAY